MPGPIEAEADAGDDVACSLFPAPCFLAGPAQPWSSK